MDSNKAEPTKSQQKSVTIEDIEDEDVQNMLNKPKLHEGTTYIIEDVSDDQHIIFNCKNNKEKHNSAHQREEPKWKPHKVPVTTGRVYECQRTPDIQECNIPTLHFTLYKYKGPSQKEEVLLAVMDANLNELNKGKEQLPDLCKKWIESAVDILTGALLHLPPV